MKILIIGHGRSRTNHCLSLLSSYYNLENLKEYYKDCSSESDLLKVAEDLKGRDNFVVKIDSCKFYELRHLNFDLFEFGMFDQIYTTRRLNVVDAVASLKVASLFNLWLYDRKNPTLKRINPIPIDPVHDTDIFLSIISGINQLDRAEQYMKEKVIPFVRLHYENIDEYAAQHWPGAISKYIESNYDYSKMISNYNDIASIYNSLQAPVEVSN